MVHESYAVRYGEIVAKCWEDEAYKKRFIQEPESVLQEAGIPLEEGINYKVIEAPKLVQYVVLPREEVMPALQFIVKRLLNKADKTEKIVPEGCEVRIIQNTEDTDYLVLPASPKTLTAAELSAVTGGDSVATASDVAAQAEVVAQVVEAVEVTTTEVSVAETSLAGVAEVGAIVVVAAVVL